MGSDFSAIWTAGWFSPPRSGKPSRLPVAPLDLSHPRDCDKREEVGSRALADCEVSRHDHRYRGRQGFSVSGTSREIPDGSGELLYPESDPPSLPVSLPREARRDLSWWMVKDHLLTGVRFRTPAPDFHLYSDASSSGWGAHLLDQHVSGVWSDQEKLLHINLLEMKALFLGLQAFR